MSLAPSIEHIRARLASAGQEHLLAFESELSAQQRASLLAQIDAIDLEHLPELIEKYVAGKPDFAPPGKIEPAPYYPAPKPDGSQSGRRWDPQRFRSAGEELIAAGRVACFVVAGGQGSRLGYDGPKGCFPGGAVSGKPLFQIFAEGIRANQRRYGSTIPWYIMTSPLNHQPTVEFFQQNDFFGLEPDNVSFFPQGVMPSFDLKSGKILLAEKHEVATNPDGHGGSLKALFVSGALDDMRTRGVEHISYFQVDNPLVKVVDPVFVGLHATASDSSGEMSSKMLPKRDPEEKVGVFVMADRRLQMIEYSDLPPELAKERDSGGGLRFNAGNPAIHMLGVSFVEKLNEDPRFALPFHRAEKKVPHIDVQSGKRVDPSSPNGVKLERFVFDALQLAERSIVLETDRVEEFAPIKNAEGVDSPESSARIQTERAARWLQRVGVSVPMKGGEPDCTIEIGPLTALEPLDLDPSRVGGPIERGAKVAL
ncbi:MAG: UDPGP type 1 family protein [Phycisphaerales bacterium]|nr:UDPGP type 1 family protein [Phycisphaerales bacterium]